MEYRTFGSSKLKTSVIGFGGWPMGKGQYGAFDEQEVVTAIHRALDVGVTLFDTAARYGVGFGEELLGKALKGKRDKTVIVTKGGTRWDAEKNALVRDSSKAFLRECLEGSLMRLGMDYVDLYLIHWPDESRPMEEPMAAFKQFQQEGKIRHGGVSNFSVAQMEECLKHFPIICNQIGYNLFDRRPEPEVMPFCLKRGIGVMTYGSLAFGLLTGAMTPDTKFGGDDWRRSGMAFGLPLFKEENFQRNLQVV
ncbi:MAG: aldo/keto reductase, partial [Chloroflexota bacterium]|nr:aldo/keto reductase [Chloroflexota bacterium]